MMLSPQWESRSEFYVHSGKCQVHSTRKLLVHTLSCAVQADAAGRQHAARSARHALYRAEPNSMSTVGMLRSTLREKSGPQWELSVYLLRLPRY